MKKGIVLILIFNIICLSIVNAQTNNILSFSPPKISKKINTIKGDFVNIKTINGTDYRAFEADLKM
jgi:hypothetical protein